MGISISSAPSSTTWMCASSRTAEHRWSSRSCKTTETGLQQPRGAWRFVAARPLSPVVPSRMEPWSSAEQVGRYLGARGVEQAGCAGADASSWCSTGAHPTSPPSAPGTTCLRVLIGDSLALLDVPELRQASRRGLGRPSRRPGAGLPGIPLCVAMPSIEVTLLESVAKKCVFLEAAVQADRGRGARARASCARSETYRRPKGSPGARPSPSCWRGAVGRPLDRVLVGAGGAAAEHGWAGWWASKTRRAAAEGGAAAGPPPQQHCGFLRWARVVALPRSPARRRRGRSCMRRSGPHSAASPAPRRARPAKRPLGGNEMKARRQGRRLSVSATLRKGDR